MATCVQINESGYLFAIDTPLQECSALVIQTAAEYKHPTIDIPAADIVTTFSWSFGLVVVVGYLPGYAIGIAKKLINKA